MEFRQIQYFVCLFEEGSVTRAARRLNIVQPALSMQVAKLEQDLGEKLFTRTSQGMQPTSEGRRIYRLFLPVVREFALAREQAAQTKGELTGLVRIGMIATIAQGVLVDALLDFTAVHPLVELSLTDGFSADLIESVSIGQLDAAVINKPRRPLALQSTGLAEEAMLLVTGNQHHQLSDMPTLQDVTQLKLALPTRQHGLRQIMESFAQMEEVQLTPSVEIDSISVLRQLVRDSDFCTLLPNVAVRSSLEKGELQGYSIASPKLIREIVCVSDHRRPLTPAASAFIAVLRRHIVGLTKLVDLDDGNPPQIQRSEK